MSVWERRGSRKRVAHAPRGPGYEGALRRQGWIQWSATAGLMRLSMGGGRVSSFGDGRESVARQSLSCGDAGETMVLKQQEKPRPNCAASARNNDRPHGHAISIGIAPAVTLDSIPRDTPGCGRRPLATWTCFQARADGYALGD
jgi:hypothetical protein